MNAEQLNGVLFRLAAAHDAGGTIAKIAALRDSLDAIANNPGSGDIQQNFRRQLDELLAALRADQLNVFSIREHGIIEETGLAQLRGSELEDRVIEATQGQDMTPRVAHEKMSKLHDAIAAQVKGIKSTAKGLANLNIGTGEPAPGTIELGYFVPRHEDNLTLSEIVKEATDLNRLLQAASELITGESQSPKVTYLTSSDYGILTDVGPPVVEMVMRVLEGGLNCFKTWQESRLLMKQLKDSGQPKELIDPIEAHNDKKLDAEIREVVRIEVVSSARIADEGRRNELTNQVTSQVRVFLEKRQSGAYVDVRVGARAEVNEEEEGEAPEASAARQKAIAFNSILNRIEALAERLHELEMGQETSGLLPPPPSTDPTPR